MLGSRKVKPLNDELTDREREVLALVAEGKRNKEIAQELVISEATVESHFGPNNTMEKQNSSPSVSKTMTDQIPETARERKTASREVSSTDLRFARLFDDFDSSIPEDRETLGGKGYGLVKAIKLGLPVPPGVIVPTSAWYKFRSAGDTLPYHIWDEIQRQLRRLEEKTDKIIGDEKSPLLVSIRSGASISMPGAMCTMLNIGINDKTIGALEREIGSHSAWEAYFSWIAGIGTFIYGMDPQKFESIHQNYLSILAVNKIHELPLGAIQRMVVRAKQEVEQAGGIITQDPQEQIKIGISAVLASWENPTAKEYRQRFRFSETSGTAVVIQQMVWGNSQKEHSGSGVLFTRDPRTLGGPVAVFAPRSQGPKVVGELVHQNYPLGQLPEPIKEELTKIVEILTSHYVRPQEVEFTFDGTQLWVLQTRDVLLSNIARLRFLFEEISRSVLTAAEAQRHVTTEQLEALLEPNLDPHAMARARQEGRLCAVGIPISHGCATAPVVTTVEEAMASDKDVIFVGPVNNDILLRLPPNIKGIVAPNGSLGSHISCTARIIGIGGMPIIFSADISRIKEITITLNGYTGEVFHGVIPHAQEADLTLLSEVERAITEKWLDERRNNPWRFITYEVGISTLIEQAKFALKQAQNKFSSSKAHAYAVINCIIPQELRMGYMIVRHNDPYLYDLLVEALEAEFDVTVRTCFTPDRRGRAPWALLTKTEDVVRFLNDPNYSLKHGGYSEWVVERELTELLVGKIPKDKLNPAPEIQWQHCSWTLACTERGDIVLQVHPFSPQLRAHEPDPHAPAWDDLITYAARFSAQSGYLELIQTRIGKDLGQNEENRMQAIKLATLVQDTVFGQWWNGWQLPQRMAATTSVFPPPRYATPVLEGQARLYPGGGSWCLVYGMKIDTPDEER